VALIGTTAEPGLGPTLMPGDLRGLVHRSALFA